VIPCYLTIACDDISALNLFCNPRSPRVRLSRVLHYLGGVEKPDSVLTHGPGDRSAPFTNTVPPPESRRASISPLVKMQQDSVLNAKLAQYQQQQNAGYRIGIGQDGYPGVHATGDLQPGVTEGDGRPVSNALWWLLPGSDEEGRVGKEGMKVLQGEIHLPSDLQPSCPFPLFDISVSICPTLNRSSPLTIDSVPRRAPGSCVSRV
jgi:hypothetical protein